jgi:hypothetical protein
MMGQGQLAVAGRHGLMEFKIGHRPRRTLADHAVLDHGETMARWQGQDEMVAVISFQT